MRMEEKRSQKQKNTEDYKGGFCLSLRKLVDIISMGHSTRSSVAMYSLWRAGVEAGSPRGRPLPQSN